MSRWLAGSYAAFGGHPARPVRPVLDRLCLPARPVGRTACRCRPPAEGVEVDRGEYLGGQDGFAPRSNSRRSRTGVPGLQRRPWPDSPLAVSQLPRPPSLPGEPSLTGLQRPAGHRWQASRRKPVPISAPMICIRRRQVDRREIVSDLGEFGRTRPRNPRSPVCHQPHCHPECSPGNPLTWVGLLTTYSKKSWLADDLSRVLLRLAPTQADQPDERLSVSSEHAPTMWRIRDRLTPDDIQLLIACYREGASLRELAAEFKIGLTNAKRLVREHGARRKDQGTAA